MFAPMYQVADWGKSVAYTTSCECSTHSSSASLVGSTTARPLPCMCWRRSEIHSTCCSMATGMFVSTDGLCGPVMAYSLLPPDSAAFRDVAALLLVGAAHFHGAPASAVVPAGVQKIPVATGAELEPPQLPRRQEPHASVRNGPQHPGEVPPIPPLPGKAPVAPHELCTRKGLPFVTA